MTADAFLLQDVFIECEDSYGPIEEMNICDNLGDHLVGNIYIKVTVCWAFHFRWLQSGFICLRCTLIGQWSCHVTICS